MEQLELLIHQNDLMKIYFLIAFSTQKHNLEILNMKFITAGTVRQTEMQCENIIIAANPHNKKLRLLKRKIRNIRPKIGTKTYSMYLNATH